jgi:hypothetical protein
MVKNRRFTLANGCGWLEHCLLLRSQRLTAEPHVNDSKGLAATSI